MVKEILFIYPDDIPITYAQRANLIGWLRQRANQFGTLWGEAGAGGIGFISETQHALTNNRAGPVHRPLVRALKSAGILSHGADPPYHLEQRIVFTRDEAKVTITLKEG